MKNFFRKTGRGIDAFISILAILLFGYNVGTKFCNLNPICFGNWICAISIFTWTLRLCITIAKIVKEISKESSKSSVEGTKIFLFPLDVTAIGYLLSFIKQISHPLTPTQFICILFVIFASTLLIGLSGKTEEVEEVKEDE